MHRLQVLKELNLLDTPPEERFDRITRLARRLFDAPIVLLALIDADRQWFKSRIGIDLAQVERSVSFCDHTIRQDDVFVVEDTLDDARFADNPFVTGEPGVRFYAGYPLETPEGLRVGSLCVIDRVPRRFDEEQRQLLRDVGQIAADEVAAFELNWAMQRQRDSEAGMRALLEHIPEGVLMLDVPGTILWVNPAAERIFGAGADALVGRPGPSLLADDPERLRAQTGLINLTPYESIGRRADGSLFPVEFTVNRLLLSGEKRMVAIVRDISRRRAADERNRATDARRRKYFATATHELRTPMASVLGFSELLLKRDFDIATGRELVEIIHRQASRLVDLINQLLDLARIEAGGKDELDIRPLGVAELIEQTLAGLSGLGEAHRIAVDVAPDLPTLAGDAQKLQQALTNIVSNAIKYSDPDAPIAVGAYLAAPGPQPAVGIRVRDRGIGMTPEQQAQIFDAFYRADKGSSVQGSGLGMTIFKEIVDLHGGTVELRSTPGAGTEVTMILPATGRSHG
ncbi:ATP-binding protein [uncultured Massilia sp.]|uniref:sensor histidine kinase n=1 Tax=uncultured Massilia sp. TaxID=169973 RepID=UPI0025E39B86|nr:ATP-binding protein [uncultured Massilia sp.]